MDGCCKNCEHYQGGTTDRCSITLYPRLMWITSDVIFCLEKHSISESKIRTLLSVPLIRITFAFIADTNKKEQQNSCDSLALVLETSCILIESIKTKYDSQHVHECVAAGMLEYAIRNYNVSISKIYDLFGYSIVKKVIFLLRAT